MAAMSTWLEKVEAMKRQREAAAAAGGGGGGAATTTTTAAASPTAAASSTTTTTTTTAGGAKPNPFLARTAAAPRTAPAPVTGGSSGTAAATTTTSAAATGGARPNPFLARAATAGSLPTTTTTTTTARAGTTTAAAAARPAAGSVSSPSSSSSSTAAAAPATAGAGGTPEVGGGLWRTRFEAEQKRRQELERQLAELQGQLRQLRAGGGGGGARAAGGAAAGGGGGRPVPGSQAARDAARKKRMTRRQTARMSMAMTSSFDSVLSSLGGLDRRIRAAEAAKLQAEDKLLEIAIAKLEVDDLVEKVDTVLSKIIEQIDKFTNAQLKGMLEKVRTQTRKAEEATAEQDSRVSCRFSIIMPKGGGLQLPEAPPLPPMPGHLGGGAGAGAAAGGRAGAAPPGRGGLLESIRQGTTLRNINKDDLRREQDALRADAKKLGDISLEDTLKSALMTKFLSAVGDEEYDDDDDWEDDDF